MGKLQLGKKERAEKKRALAEGLTEEEYIKLAQLKKDEHAQTKRKLAESITKEADVAETVQILIYFFIFKYFI